MIHVKNGLNSRLILKSLTLKSKTMHKVKLFTGILAIGLILMAGCKKDEEPPVSLVTTPISDTTSISASSGGTITADAGVIVTARGVCWAITAAPTIASNKTIDGDGTGTFESTLTGLISNTLYHVRAYATAASVTYYGDELTFTTTAATELIENGDFSLPNDATDHNPISLIPGWLIDDNSPDNSGRSFDGTDGIAWHWDGTSGIYQLIGTVPSTATKYSVAFEVACDYSYWSDPTFNIDVYAIFSAYSGTDPTTRVPIDSITFVSATSPYDTWVHKAGDYTLPAGNSHAGEHLVFEIEIFNSRDWGYDESWTYLLYDDVSVKQASGK